MNRVYSVVNVKSCHFAPLERAYQRFCKKRFKINYRCGIVLLRNNTLPILCYIS